MRIHITGNAGAGKTTLARRIATVHDLPLHHLDSIVWNANWTKPSVEERDARVSALTETPEWVIEGVSELVRDKADIIVYLTTPTLICLYRCVVRCFKVGFRTREELPPNCPEIAILPEAVRIVLGFQRRIGNQMLRESHTDSRYLLARDAAHANDLLQQHRPFR